MVIMQCTDNIFIITDNGYHVFRSQGGSLKFEPDFLATYCYQLLFGQGDKIHCKECKRDFTFYFGDFDDVARATADHVRLHVVRPWISCNHDRCGEKRTTVASVRAHIKRSHPVVLDSGNYVDSGLKHADQLISMAVRCFGQNVTMGSTDAR